MIDNTLSRRHSLALMPGAMLLSAAQVKPSTAQDPRQAASRERRMKWWHDAKFGMFIHFGLFSVVGKDVWNYESEGWTMKEYEPLIHQFNPRPGSTREWAKLARRAGQKYMVLTTKNHDGFCIWDTKT